MKKFMLIVFVVLSVSVAYAENVCPDYLFDIAKSTNSYAVMYEPNIAEDGTLNEYTPVVAHWVKWEGDVFTDGDALGVLEKKLAYGVKYLNDEKDQFFVVSVPKQILALNEESGCFTVRTLINGEMAELNKVYVELEGTGVFSDIEAITLTGKSLATGDTIEQRMINEE